VKAHQADLRAEVAQQRGADGSDGAAFAAAFAADIAAQGSEAAPEPRLRALLQFAERLAADPAGFEEQHLLPLREAGLDDRAIHDAAQVVAYFSYINRIADGLGVDLEPEME
jgi:uncharacterized peroxidase-related enzyme